MCNKQNIDKIKLTRKDWEIQQQFIQDHHDADLFTFDKDKQPALAVYVNPIWRGKVDGVQIVSLLEGAMGYYETEQLTVDEADRLGETIKGVLQKVAEKKRKS